MKNTKNLKVYNKKDLSLLMLKMAEENKIPLSTIFKHIAFLAQNKYYGERNIDEINPSLEKSTIIFDQNIIRKLMSDFQAPGISKQKFVKEFIEVLWENKINKTIEKKHKI